MFKSSPKVLRIFVKAAALLTIVSFLYQNRQEAASDFITQPPKILEGQEQEKKAAKDISILKSGVILEQPNGRLYTSRDCISSADVNISVVPAHEISKNVIDEADSEDAQHRKESFNDIFQKDIWSKQSKSGAGSLLENAERIIKTITVIIEKIKIEKQKKIIRILDSSCGDMGWMPSFLEYRPDIEYTGYDIVPDNINNHKANFANEGWKFEVHDLVTDPITSSFDLILSRHTTQHLKNADIAKIIRNFKDSKSSYLLTTNFPNNKDNPDLDENKLYRIRMINLFLPPFNFPPPICHSHDFDHDWITLWDLDSIKI